MIWAPISNLIQELPILPDVVVVYGSLFPLPGIDPMQFLTQEEVQSFELMKHPGQKKVRFTCRATTRWLLSLYTGEEATRLVLMKNRYGKPCLCDEAVEFNVSHTDHRFLIGVSRISRMGVDIESPAALPNLQEMAAYAFSPAEMERFTRHPDQFFDLWSRKEAMLKAFGMGLPENPGFIDTGSMLSQHDLEGVTFECPHGETATIVHGRSGFPDTIFSL